MHSLSRKQTTHGAPKSPVTTNHTRPPFWTLSNGGHGLDHGFTQVEWFKCHTHNHQPRLFQSCKVIPCTTNITREGVAALYLQHLVPWFSIPRKIISDRDLCFISHFTTELCRLLHIQRNVLTVFHPRTDRASEWANQWLEQYLRIWTADDQTRWAQYLSLAEFVHNSWPHDRTTLTPHKLLFGVKPPFPLSDEEAKTPNVTTRL